MFNRKTLRSRFFVALALCFVGLLLLGGVQVQNHEQQRDRVVERSERQILMWHQQVASELPEDQRTRWLKEANIAPMALLRACAIETRPTR